MALQAEKCHGCGQPRSESMDIANEDAYEPHKLRCHACATRDSEQKRMGESQIDSAGLYVSVTKRRDDDA
jgi:hypothetical protein